MMPSMYEIYEQHAVEYDELVNREDYKGNIPSYLEQAVDFTGKTVIEFGTGTGRLTSMYLMNAARVFCYDRSEHMLEKAKKNLAGFNKIAEFGLCDNLGIDGIDKKADIIIEGWSFGHTVNDDDSRVDEITDKIISDCRKLLKPGGCIILLESLGTNTPAAAEPTAALKEFHTRLEEKHSFARTVLETDYKFESNDEALRVGGFFFGEEFKAGLVFKEEGIIPEYTGAWFLSV